MTSAATPTADDDVLQDGIRRDLALVRWAWLGVLALVAVLAGLGLFLLRDLALLTPLPAGQRSPWLGLLGALTVGEIAAAFLLRRWFTRPDRIVAQVARVFAEADLPLVLPPALAAEVAVRAAFLGDAVAWLLLQFLVIYGLGAAIVLGHTAPIAGSAVVAASLILVTRPTRARCEALAVALQAQVASRRA
jgi:hypothetical protein